MRQLAGGRRRLRLNLRKAGGGNGADAGSWRGRYGAAAESRALQRGNVEASARGNWAMPVSSPKALTLVVWT